MTTLTGAGTTARRASHDRDVDTAGRSSARTMTRTASHDQRAETPVRSRREGNNLRSSSRSVARKKRTSTAKRMGSRQVISVRGRRVVSEERRVKRTTIQFIVVCILLIGVGVGVTMYLSGVTTQQSFAIQKAKDKKTTLDNELEGLHRDVKNASSNSEVAKKASEDGMVVPDQPGIMTVNPDGSVVENRAADPSKTHEIHDINSGADPKAKASSDPEKTKNTSSSATSSSSSGRDNNRTAQLAPYQDNTAGAVAAQDDNQAASQSEGVDGEAPLPADQVENTNPAPDAASADDAAAPTP
ncbi:hypothetical protein [uncultured Corynebacterium sp.]|uniref:hypothetical protein n=1 Tax=uncultured Corynebacterium sp. TaxID=159447 RepID=UPI0025E63632|nr:hypothetical protein [uncultured Corynebacterium sp.]